MNQRRCWALLVVLVLLSFGGYQGYQHWLDVQDIAEEPARPRDPRLAELVSVDVENASLRAVLDALAKANGFEFLVDTQSLAALSLTGDETVTAYLPNMSLATVLNHLPRQANRNLTIRVEGETWKLAARSGAKMKTVDIQTRLYLLTDHFATPHPIDYASLGQLITSLIAPDTWQEVGGYGILEAVPNALLISQTSDVHDQIRALLSRLGNLDQLGFAPIFLDDSAAPSEHIKNALDQQVSVDFWQASLRDIVRWVSAEYDVPIAIDRVALLDFGIDDTEKSCTIQLEDITLRAALGIILQETELVLLIDDRQELVEAAAILVVTTPSQAEARLTHRLYPIGDLIAWLDGGADDLIRVLTRCVDPDNWDAVGGPGAIELYSGCLLVSQTMEAHEQLEELLWEVRRHALPYLQSNFPSPTRPRPAECKIEETLQRLVTIDTTKEPLDQFARRLSDELRINIRINRRDLDDYGISINVPITGEQKGLPFGVALRNVLAPLELTTSMREEVLWITGWEENQEAVTNGVYFVGDLAWMSDGTRDIQPIIDSLQQLIAPDCWDRVGGPAYAMELGNLLVVSADADIHRATRWFLTALRTRDAVQPLWDPAPSDGREERYLRAYDMAKLWDGWLAKAVVTSGRDGEWYLQAIQGPLANRNIWDDEVIGLHTRIVDTIETIISSGTSGAWPRMSVQNGRLMSISTDAEHENILLALQSIEAAVNSGMLGSPTLAGPQTSSLTTRLHNVTTLCQRYDGLNAELLAAAIRQVVTPFDTSAIRPYPPVVTALPDLLVVRDVEEGHLNIEWLLQHLATDFDSRDLFVAGDPVGESGHDHAPLAQRLLEDLGSDDKLTRDFAAWALGTLGTASEAVIASLVDHLSKSFEANDEAAQHLSLMALLKYDGAVVAATPTLENMLQEPSRQKHAGLRGQLIVAFCQCGSSALPALRRLLLDASVLNRVELNAILQAWKTGAQPATPEILSWIDANGFDGIDEAFYEVDPAFARSREVLRQWRRSADPAIKAKVEKLANLLYLGAR